MKLHDYVLFHQNELGKILKVNNVAEDIICAGKLIDTSYFLYDIGFDIEDKQCSLDLKVRIGMSEENKSEIVDAIKEIIEQIKIKNYDCRVIDKGDFTINNAYNNDDICILKIWEEVTEVYNCDKYNEEHNWLTNY